MEIQINPSDYIILVCDDEESVRGLLAEALSGWGFQTATAPNGEAALKYLKAGHLPHIVLTDIRMGGMTGIELAAEVKKISDEIEVIIMTSHGSFETAVQAMRLGVHDYLSKPFENIDDVRRLLVHVCKRIYMRFYSEHLLGELKRKSAEIEGLANMATELSKTLDMVHVMNAACEGISKAFQAPTLFFQVDPIQNSLVVRSRFPDKLLGGAEFRVAQITDINSQSFSEKIAACRAMSPELLPPNGAEWKSFLFNTRNKFVGVFSLYVKNFDEKNKQNLLNRYMQSIVAAFENTELHEKVVEISVRDGLTGLFNVRHFRDRFSQEMVLSKRLGHPVSLIFMDVDHFKKYNDTHGHPAGDEVLKLMAQLMNKNFRSTDILCRYGGEEFVVLLTHTSFSDAVDKAERFRALVESTPFPQGQTQPLGKISVSLGVSEYPTIADTVEGVIKAADDALYEAKKTSRNIVVPAKAAPGYAAAFQSVSLRSRESVSSGDK